MQDTALDLPIYSRLMTLFEGYARAYGTYTANVGGAVAPRELGSKVEIKATVRTNKLPVTVDLWREHYEGETPIGIIPIRDNNTCLWGCVDIDEYDMDYVALVAGIREHKLPLVPCRSKSGGLHLFLFMADPCPAVIVQTRLREMAQRMGKGTAEVFPKQVEVFWQRGDLGSWLNMPYFMGPETDRYGIKDNGLAMTAEEFVAAALAARVTREHLTDTQYRKTARRTADSPRGEPDFGDGPPCMQHLTAEGFPAGTRNIGLFSLGTFAKKKYGHRWTEMLEDWNRKFMDPPLPAGEVLDIIKQLNKKDYNYKCKEQPLSQFCNASLCRTRRFGVGNEEDCPQISGLSVLKTVPPLWFVDVGDRRIELTTEQLQSYPLFHRCCIEQLMICYRSMKQDTWLQIVGQAMRDVIEIEVSEEAGLPGQFNEILEDFLLNKHRGSHQDDLLSGRPWEGPHLASGEMFHWFRMRDFRKALDLANFKFYSNGQIVARLRTMGVEQRFFNLLSNTKGVNAWGVPSRLFQVTGELPLPAVEESPI